uniref:Uncharacterized protein n=1 Tax=Trichobilharzia regenti TaxID=157069 RepID=A0AA85JXI6_TRIRE|nr:unnamed protein product [Trichobilharzia regenti]
MLCDYESSVHSSDDGTIDDQQQSSKRASMTKCNTAPMPFGRPMFSSDYWCLNSILPRPNGVIKIIEFGSKSIGSDA